MTAPNLTQPKSYSWLEALQRAETRIRELERALEDIKSWRDDTFGSEAGEEFNSGARVALYRCADRAIAALEEKEPK